MRRTDGLTLVVISHDLEDMGLACTRTIEVTDGTVVPPGAQPGQPAASQPARPRRGGLVFRAVPGTSALHRLGPATKIGVLASATIASFVVPELAHHRRARRPPRRRGCGREAAVDSRPAHTVAGHGDRPAWRRGGGRGQRNRPLRAVDAPHGPLLRTVATPYLDNTGRGTPGGVHARSPRHCDGLACPSTSGRTP